MNEKKVWKNWKKILLGVLTVVGAGYGVNIAIDTGDKEVIEINCIIQFDKTYRMEDGSTMEASKGLFGTTRVIISPSV